MNGPVVRKIEILAPFNQAIELTKTILFRPFNLEKWLVIGFAAFLSHLASGGGGSFNYRSGQWSRTSHHIDFSGIDHTYLWLILLLIVIGALLLLAICLVLMWLGCRGRFIFLDCVVRNRGAIKEPWREFRTVANSFFVFLVVVTLLLIAVALVTATPLIAWYVIQHQHIQFGPGLLILLICWCAFILVLALAWSFISEFMVVAMYCRRCRALEAFRYTVSLITSDPASFILYLLFLFVLALGIVLIGCLATCLTCCIAALPYVGTVILLPFYVFLTGYQLLFLRQFGPDWDAWAKVMSPAETTPPPAQTVEPTMPSSPQQSAPPSPPEVPSPPEPSSPPQSPDAPERSPYEPPDSPPPQAS